MLNKSDLLSFDDFDIQEIEDETIGTPKFYEDVTSALFLNSKLLFNINKTCKN